MQYTMLIGGKEEVRNVEVGDSIIGRHFNVKSGVYSGSGFAARVIAFEGTKDRVRVICKGDDGKEYMLRLGEIQRNFGREE